METDREFLARFESASLPAASWTHETRLRATFLLLQEHDFQEATRRMRIGIRNLNAGGDGRYGEHETLTLAWARLVEQARAHAEPVADFATFLAHHPELRRSDLVFEHYSPARLWSERARREFVLPDLAPLPTAPRSPAVAQAVRNSSLRRKDPGGASPDPAPRSTNPISRRN